MTTAIPTSIDMIGSDIRNDNIVPVIDIIPI
jgi:hypothetical protein